MATETYEVGTRVHDTKTEQDGTIVASSKGWYTIELDDGEEAKRRAADLEAAQEEQDEPEDDEETTGGTMSRKLRRYAQQYTKATNTKGTATRICGDSISRILLQLTLDQTYGTASNFLGDTVEALRARYAHLNPGQQRMNLGNRIRGLAKRIVEDDPKADIETMLAKAAALAVVSVKAA